MGIWGSNQSEVIFQTSNPTTSDTSYPASTLWINVSEDRVWMLLGLDGSNDAIWRELGSDFVPMTPVTDPATNAATSTANIDSYSGVLITLTAAGNAQTLQDPTDTAAGKKYTVVNVATSSDDITVNSIVLSPGESQAFIWDGAAWQAITATDAQDITFVPAGLVAATNVQAGIEELDSEKMHLLGRSGGQVLYGGTGSGDDLTLHSTSNATKGSIFLGANSAYDQVNDRLGIGVASPTTALHISGSGGANSRLTLEADTNGSGDLVLIGTRSSSDADIGRINGYWESTQVAEIRFSTGDDTVNKDNAHIDFYTTPDGTTPARRMRITDAGYLGIGEDTPLGKVHIKSADLGSISPPTAGDELVLESDGATGMSIYGSSTCRIYFADVDSDTVGMIEYAHGTDKLTFRAGGSDSVYLDSSGNLGIGEDTPLGKVHIKSGDAGVISPSVHADELVIEGSGNSGISIYSGNTSWGTIYFGDAENDQIGHISYGHTNDEMVFYTNAGERIRITADGYVGIGETDPDYAFHVKSADSGKATIKIESTNTGNGAYYRGFADRPSSDAGITGLYGHWADTQVAAMEFVTGDDVVNKDDGYITFLTSNGGSFNEKVRIEQDGKVGIGTDSPTVELDVAGAGEFSGGLTVGGDLTVAATTVTLNLDASGSAFFVIDRGTSGATGRTFYRTAGAEEFQTGLVAGVAGYHITDGSVNELLTVLSSGKVGIGETAPLGKLHVKWSDSGATVDGTADALVLESSSAAGMSILSGTSNTGRIYFGNSGSNNIGGIEYGHATNYMTFKVNDSNRMTIASNGNVGIGSGTGMTTPTHELTVSNSASATTYTQYVNAVTNYTATDGFLVGVGGANGDAILLNKEDTDMEFYTNDQQRMTIDNAGKVGIGETSPDYTLHVSSNTGDQAAIKIEATTSGHAAVLRCYADRTGANQGLAGWYGYWNDTRVASIKFNSGTDTTNKDDGDISFEVGEGGTVSEAMRIAQGGSVGIGESSPLGKLHVKTADVGAITPNASGDELVLENSVSCGMTIAAGNAYASAIYFADSDDTDIGVLSYDHSTDNMIFRTNNANRVLIDSSGNVGIGEDSPDVPLHITGTGNALKFERATDAGALGRIQTKNNTGNNVAFMSFESDTATTGHIEMGVNGAGNALTIGTTGKITLGSSTSYSNADLNLDGDGVLMLKETTTPTADTDYGKVYTKNDNKLYFQDGAGTEHEVAFV